MRWFTFDSEEGITIHADQAGAVADAENRIAAYRDVADSEWPEEVESVGIGVIQPVTRNVYRNADGEEFWDYTMEPVDPDPYAEAVRLRAEVEIMEDGLRFVLARTRFNTGSHTIAKVFQIADRTLGKIEEARENAAKAAKGTR